MRTPLTWVLVVLLGGGMDNGSSFLFHLDNLQAVPVLRTTQEVIDRTELVYT
jgi:hypothetical protein